MTVTAAETGQVSSSAAEIYDAFFVPALFAQWASRLCDAAGVETGTTVLDVACGTGATTREAAKRAGTGGRVVGLDCNPGMLAVAGRQDERIEWVEGSAEALPFEQATFDAVLCNFGLMFFTDRAAALSEMRRVIRPGGTVALGVWDVVDNSPGYAGMIRLIEDSFGTEAADALRAPFCLGTDASLAAVLAAGGLETAKVATVDGTARFASIRDWVRTDVRGWTLSDLIDDDGFEALVAKAEDRLHAFVLEDGSVRFPAPARIVTWRAPAVASQ